MAYTDQPVEYELDKLAQDVGIVVDGNIARENISAGQYVILKNSTISGKEDGLYTLTSGDGIAKNGTVSAGRLSAVTGGIANALNGNLTQLSNLTIM